MSQLFTLSGPIWPKFPIPRYEPEPGENEKLSGERAKRLAKQLKALDLKSKRLSIRVGKLRRERDEHMANPERFAHLNIRYIECLNELDETNAQFAKLNVGQEV